MSLIVVVRNISGLAATSDYEYTVLVGDGGPDSQVLETGLVIAHKRSDGWPKLVEELLSQRVTKDD